jgi:hypothetical protein
MGKASRRKRQATTAPVAAASSPLRLERLDLVFVGVAWALWFAAHFPGVLGDLAIPAWVVVGIALGLFRPWLGLLLTILVVPFLGGATVQPTGEMLRVVPILGAAIRVVFDRVMKGPTRAGPDGRLVIAAVAATALYAFTLVIGFGSDEAILRANIVWLIGGPIAMMAAWLTASHVVEGRYDTLADAALVATVVGCTFALASWFGMPGTDLFGFPAEKFGRLAALGFPTPTAIGVATTLPFAYAAAARRNWLAGLAVGGLGLVVIILTQSRGPLIALGVATVVAILLSGRLTRRTAIAGVAVGTASLVALIGVRYGTDPQQIVNAISGSTGSDADRINTWLAAISIAIASPLVGGGWRSLERFGDGEFAQRAIAYSHNIVLHGFAEGGLPLGIANGAVVLGSAFMAWRNRLGLPVFVTASAVAFLVCGLWDIPQVRSYGAVMGGIALGLVAERVPVRVVGARRASDSRARIGGESVGAQVGGA